MPTDDAGNEDTSPEQPAEQPPATMPPGYYPPYGAPGYYPPLGAPGYPPAYLPGTDAPPSQPPWPGYGYAAPPTGPYGPPPYFPYPPYMPPTPRRRTGLIIGIISGVVALLVVVVVGCGLLGNVLLQQANANYSAVRATLTASAPTPTTATTLTPGGTILYDNSFANDDTGWSDDGTHCFLDKDGYHVKAAGCFAPVGPVSDVDIVVQAKQLAGPANYGFGIMLRAQSEPGKFYGVVIDSSGRWAAYRCIGVTKDGAASDCKYVVNPKAASAIHPGRGVSNTLEVRAEGSEFQVYVNGTNVGSFEDSTYPTGEIGLVSTAVDAIFTNLSISLPN